jgi:O-antigen/teichoic acid export membrane protein
MAAGTPASDGQASQSVIRSLAKNSAASLARLGFTSLVAIFLPAYLTHRLPVAIYGAWVLILQLAAYVSYLDLGVQTAVSKYIAEYEAKKDLDGCRRCASVGLAIMVGACIVGILLTLGLAWFVPRLFRTMPAEMYRDVRISVVLVGVSLSLNLVASIFSAIFMGLQRYEIPMLTTVASKLLYGLAVCLSVYFHTSLAVMGAGVAAANLAGALIQVIAWKRLANHVRVTLNEIDRGMLRQMLRYCAVLTIWSACMLIVSGIDLTIVGHYDFGQTAFYSIAISPTNFVLMLIGSLLGPLLPATSALNTKRTPEQMGDLLLRATRYATVILLATGLPALVGGYWLLRLWVGPIYALYSVRYLRILLLANIVRNLCAPYATVICAVGKQDAAIVTALSEAAVNLGGSIYLASRLGAIGVAFGTLLGSLVSVALHFVITMRLTNRILAISRARLFMKGLVQPAVMSVPSVIALFIGYSPLHMTLKPESAILWCLSTFAFAWFGSLNLKERNDVMRFAGTRLQHLRHSAAHTTPGRDLDLEP